MYIDILDNMNWSFSRLNSFYSCKRNWYYNYIMKKESSDNFFSQYGTFAHKIFEYYNKGKIELFEMSKYYSDNFNNEITMDAPPNKFVDLKESYFKKGYNYFVNFNGYCDEFVGSEVPFDINIKAYNKERRFIGYIDRISKDENGYIITDYKSKGKFKSQEELKEYTRQLYIYAIALKEMYNEYPYKLVFEQFKEGITIEQPFVVDNLKETKKWISSTIKSIYAEKDFPKKENDFFCQYLCGIGIDNCE